jgi:hypothetical protein
VQQCKMDMQAIEPLMQCIEFFMQIIELLMYRVEPCADHRGAYVVHRSLYADN